MRVVIAGSRSITDYNVLIEALAECPFHPNEISEVVCGGAPGVDLLGDLFAHDFKLPVEYFLVTPYRIFDKLENMRYDERGNFTNVRYAGDYDRNGNVAFRDRNEAMSAYADALIAVRARGPDGLPSKGTTMMISLARAYGCRVFVKDVT